MKWRNEQIYHLRQNKPLTLEDQNNYFKNVVAKVFGQEQPDQLLFSFLKDDNCVGYGGLVHISWTDRNAEISFVMDTALEKEHFNELWIAFLYGLEEIAFVELKFHKIFTYAFDLRPHLYIALTKAGFKEEARLKEHCFFEEKYLDVVIHSKKSNDKIKLLLATVDDAKLLFHWANDKVVRANSLSVEPILWEDHVKWFSDKLRSQTKIYLLYINSTAIGQIRFDLIDGFWNIDYSIDNKYRGKGFGKMIIELAMRNFEQGDALKAIVKTGNSSSLVIFQKLGFEEALEIDSDVVTFKKEIR